MNSTQASEYKTHLNRLAYEWGEAISAHKCDAIVVSAGENPFYYEDDQNPPFHPNPHFLRWVPESDCEHAVLLIKPGEMPRVYWYQPADYWYEPAQPPEFLSDQFAVEVHNDTSDLYRAVDNGIRSCREVAHLGPLTDALRNTRFAQTHNPGIARHLDYLRAYKSDFELSCMQQATARAVRGHLAVAERFHEAASEFDLHMCFLDTTKQAESELPYPNIIALNQHAATLHYQHYDRERPREIRSLLIDAGAKATCYHADITRSYAYDQNSPYVELLARVDEVQQEMIASLRPLQSFVELHERMHLALCEALVETGVLKCSAESGYERKLSDIFYPHGTGHLLGLQTHDVGGKLVDRNGSEAESPARFPSLRLLRQIENRVIFTVEPGIYFIPMLLEAARGHPDINWTRVDEFLPYGGVRIEDNVVFVDGELDNLTRTAFAAFDPST